MLEAAMGSVPMEGSAPIDVSRPGGGGGGGGGQAAGTPGELPAWLFDMESDRESEPITAGLAEGPGAGPEALSLMPSPEDDAEAVLAFVLELEPGDRAAQQMLQEMQAARMAVAPPVAPPGPMTPAPVDADPAMGDQIEAEEIDFPDDVPETETASEPVEEGDIQELPPDAPLPVAPGEGEAAPVPEVTE